MLIYFGRTKALGGMGTTSSLFGVCHERINEALPRGSMYSIRTV